MKILFFYFLNKISIFFHKFIIVFIEMNMLRCYTEITNRNIGGVCQSWAESILLFLFEFNISVLLVESVKNVGGLRLLIFIKLILVESVKCKLLNNGGACHSWEECVTPRFIYNLRYKYVLQYPVNKFVYGGVCHSWADCAYMHRLGIY